MPTGYLCPRENLTKARKKLALLRRQKDKSSMFDGDKQVYDQIGKGGEPIIRFSSENSLRRFMLIKIFAENPELSYGAQWKFIIAGLPLIVNQLTRRRKKMKRKGWLLVSLFLLLALLVGIGTANATPTVNSGFDASATLYGEASYRNLKSGGGNEILVGKPGLPAGQYSTNGDLIYATLNTVTLSYSSTSGLLTARVAPSGGTAREQSYNIGTSHVINYINVAVVASAQNSVTFDNVTVNTESVTGNFYATGAGSLTQKNIQNIIINSNGSFTMVGTLTLSGSFGGGDSAYLDLAVGYLATGDNIAPTVKNLLISPAPQYLNGPVEVTATIEDTQSAIQSAQYSLNNGTWLPMAPSDGAFDQLSENVRVTFLATKIGTNEVCVKGSDIYGNVSDVVCKDFKVIYRFEGFFSPIENGEAVNFAKAGQAIPAKWRLTDYNNTPISDPASFEGLSSYEVDCDSFAGDPLAAVDEVASGSSGLQYIGDGYWQFNWKTPKNYADSCRAMYVEFNCDAISPVVRFHFKK